MNDLQLTLAPGIRHTTRDVFFPNAMTHGDWMGYGRFLHRAKDGLTFWRARWMAYGRTTYGDDAVREAISQLEFEFSEVRKAQLLNSLDVRDPELTAEHHFVLGKAKLDKTGLDMWVALAKKESLSANELQESIKVGRVTKIETEPGGSGAHSAGVATVQGIARQWDLLMRQIGDLWQEWTPKEIDQFLDETRPIASFREKIIQKRNAIYGTTYQK